jgi:hypothetical protein
MPGPDVCTWHIVSKWTISELFSTSTERIAAMIQFTKEYEEIGVHASAWQNCCKLM